MQHLIGPNSFIFDEEYGPNSFILDSKSIFRVGQKTAKLNGANAVSTAIVKHVLENFDNFLAGEIIGLVHLHTLTSTKIKYFLQEGTTQIRKANDFYRASAY